MSLDVLNLLLVLLAAVAGGWIARRFGYPAILAEPSELFVAAGVDERQAALTSLPIVIQTPDGYESYASDRDLASDDRVEALGRIERNASIEQSTVAAPD
jgi:hypothetical protein